MKGLVVTKSVNPLPYPVGGIRNSHALDSGSAAYGYQDGICYLACLCFQYTASI